MDSIRALRTEEHNLIVVSDVHIGQDCNGLSHFRTLRRIVRLDQELCAFLRYYAAHRVDEKPWRLVLAGDVIDFMQVNLRPEGPEARTRWHSFQLSDDERRYGVGYGGARAVWKLERIVARHRRVFLALAEFVAAGNEVCIIRGNHDEELYWAEVQHALVDLLEELYRHAHPAASETGIQEGVRFFPWFYYQEGLLYVEHGHQYDEFSSFEYFLDPVPPREDRHQDLPLPMMALRYFANLFPGFPVHEQDSWTFGDYARWLWKTGNPFRILYMFFRMVAKVLFVHRRGRVLTPPQAGWLERRLAEIEQRSGVPRDVLHRMHQLHVKPAGHSLWHSIQMLFLDRFLVVLGLFVLVLTALIADVPGWARGLWVGASFAIAGGLLWWLARLRNVSCNQQLHVAARRLAEYLQVKFVVMGHTHEPLARPAAERGAWYLNTGTWVPPKARKVHEGACDCHLTHLAVVAGKGGVRAQLLRWCGAARRPEMIDEVG